MSNPKFIQISNSDAWLYALDENGQVWEFQPDKQHWIKLSSKRKDEKAE